MKNEINLFTQRKHFDRRLRQQLTLLRNVSIGLLFVVTASSMILFFLIAASPLPEIKKQESAALFRISQLHVKMGKHLLVQDQLKHVDKLEKARDRFDELLPLIKENSPPTVRVKSVQIEKKEMVLTFATATLSDFNPLIEQVEELTSNQKIFEKVLVNSLSLVPEDGEYEIELSIGQK